MMPRKSDLTFEEALAKLEAIVARMERGDLPLKDLMADYSEGVVLSKQCLQSLERAEKTMDIFVSEDGADVKEQKLTIEGE